MKGLQLATLNGIPSSVSLFLSPPDLDWSEQHQPENIAWTVSLQLCCCGKLSDPQLPAIGATCRGLCRVVLC